MNKLTFSFQTVHRNLTWEESPEALLQAQITSYLRCSPWGTLWIRRPELRSESFYKRVIDSSYLRPNLKINFLEHSLLEWCEINLLMSISFSASFSWWMNGASFFPFVLLHCQAPPVNDRFHFHSLSAHCVIWVWKAIWSTDAPCSELNWRKWFWNYTHPRWFMP